MLRITPVNAKSAGIKVEGRLVAASVEEFSRVAGDLLAEGSLRLDVADLTFVDQAGAALLRSLADRGVEFVGCSDFVRTLLNGGTR